MLVFILKRKKYSFLILGNLAKVEVEGSNPFARSISAKVFLIQYFFEEQIFWGILQEYYLFFLKYD